MKDENDPARKEFFKTMEDKSSVPTCIIGIGKVGMEVIMQIHERKSPYQQANFHSLVITNERHSPSHTNLHERTFQIIEIGTTVDTIQIDLPLGMEMLALIGSTADEMTRRMIQQLSHHCNNNDFISVAFLTHHLEPSMNQSSQETTFSALKFREIEKFVDAVILIPIQVSPGNKTDITHFNHDDELSPTVINPLVDFIAAMMEFFNTLTSINGENEWFFMLKQGRRFGAITVKGDAAKKNFLQDLKKQFQSQLKRQITSSTTKDPKFCYLLIKGGIDFSFPVIEGIIQVTSSALHPDCSLEWTASIDEKIQPSTSFQVHLFFNV